MEQSRQGNNGKATSTTTFRIGLGGGEGGSESGTNNHCDENIVEHSVAT